MKGLHSVLMVMIVMMWTSGCFSSDTKTPLRQPLVETRQTPAATEGSADPAEDKVSGEHAPTGSSVPSVEGSSSSPAPREGAAVRSPASDVPVPEETASSGPPAAGQKTEKQLIDQYRQELAALQSYYSGQLNALTQEAMADYQSKKMSKQAIYAKYAKRGIELKEESQARVNQVLVQMKSELKKNNLPTESVNELRSDYYSELDKAKASMMDQVKKVLGM